MICEIYLSEKIDDQWQEPQKLPYPINDENYTTTQPALGVYLRTGADILYFVSDREGTRGGLDIWYAVSISEQANLRSHEMQAGQLIHVAMNAVLSMTIQTGLCTLVLRD